jgi:hypothetical protein
MRAGAPDTARAALDAAGAWRDFGDSMTIGGHSADEWLFHWDTTQHRFGVKGADAPSLHLSIQRQNAVLGAPARTQMEFHVDQSASFLQHGWSATKSFFGR